MEEKLLQIVQRLETDYVPFGKSDPDGPDCSSGCRHFVKLANGIEERWGVCANPRSSRAGLLTYEQQGCAAFEPITVDRNLTDSQLRSLITDASQILHNRRRQHIDPLSVPTPAIGAGGFSYRVRTSYFPHIKDHFPTIFRLEWHDDGWLASALESRVSGNERPTVVTVSPANNGDLFKIVRRNGDCSYQLPWNGHLKNLKEFGDLSDMGISHEDMLCRFLEQVEQEIFDKIVKDTQSSLKWTKRHLDEGRERLERWRRKEFYSDERPKNKTELREKISDEEQTVREAPTSITQSEVFIDLLRKIDRSNLLLKFVGCPPAQDGRVSTLKGAAKTRR